MPFLLAGTFAICVLPATLYCWGFLRYGKLLYLPDPEPNVFVSRVFTSQPQKKIIENVVTMLYWCMYGKFPPSISMIIFCFVFSPMTNFVAKIGSIPRIITIQNTLEILSFEVKMNMLGYVLYSGPGCLHIFRPSGQNMT